jgi:hypothetical protein
MVENTQSQNIINRLNIFIDEARYAGKTDANKKSYERKKYRKTKHQKKNSLERLRRSGEGKKRRKRGEDLEKIGRTPTNKGKTRYHV